ncbi:hypothetical protein Q31b_08400 [Novipirellula aureliae]|uniref:Uncharacterized protein n=1 Tax=Novipirellula aureliae TaxID=2527966 RepID=A0A5C6EAZ0_9BACT|nr:hypothetical protein [Novipirellula aureliae]TWU45664.1 hypothetical protein Q31b_08400 [Novipirellula aureliae]
MQQVKIFKSVDTELADLEQQINRWMRKSGAKVISITGNLASSPHASAGPLNTFAASDILLVVLYQIDPPG